MPQTEEKLYGEAADVAEAMIKKYGHSRAIEYASGYGSGAYWEVKPAGRAYWALVVEEMKRRKEPK